MLTFNPPLVFLSFAIAAEIYLSRKDLVRSSQEHEAEAVMLKERSSIGLKFVLFAKRLHETA
ncbi:MAG: hypothetical protein DPW09_35280 [Anaerolineae bacterium]|nr:hypothetical protein [Anaerolineae bacterium]